MKTYQYAATAMFLAALSASPVAFGQTTSCFPLPPGTTTPPAGVVLPPGYTWCAPVAAAPAATATPAAPAATPFSASQGEGYAHASAKGKQEIAEHFAMSGTVSGDVLTVTSMASGHIRVGTVLSGQGLPGNGITITEVLTGNGGVGTYRFKQAQ